jgi:hypothetical protein
VTAIPDVCAQAAATLSRVAADTEDPTSAAALRAQAADLLAGHADPFSASDALLAARVIVDRPTDAEWAARRALEHGAHQISPHTEEHKSAVGRLRADRLAAFFGWEWSGYGYPREGALFIAPSGEVSLDGSAMSALLAYVYATEKKA